MYTYPDACLILFAIDAKGETLDPNLQPLGKHVRHRSTTISNTYGEALKPGVACPNGELFAPKLAPDPKATPAAEAMDPNPDPNPDGLEPKLDDCPNAGAGLCPNADAAALGVPSEDDCPNIGVGFCPNGVVTLLVAGVDGPPKAEGVLLAVAGVD